MRSKKQQPNQNPAPIYRSIKTSTLGERDQAIVRPGATGQAAVTAAALHQLNRYADDIQSFLNDSRLDAILDHLHADLDYADPDLNPAPSHLR